MNAVDMGILQRTYIRYWEVEIAYSLSVHVPVCASEKVDNALYLVF